MNRSMPCSKKRSGEQKRPEAWPDPTRNAHCGSNTRSDSHTTHRSGQILWPNQFNMKTAPKKQAEGSLTLAKEGPEPETIRNGNQINEIDLVGEQTAQHFRERGGSAGDWDSTCSMLEHHLVTRSKNRFLRTRYGLLRKRFLCDWDTAQVSEHWYIQQRTSILFWLSSKWCDKQSRGKQPRLCTAAKIMCDFI